MNPQSKGLLAVWTGIAPEADAEFNEWYNREHVPERAANEGFYNARRYVAIEGQPRYFAAYDTESLATLGSPAYVEALANQSQWSLRMFPHFRDTTRMIAEQPVDLGGGTGGALLSLRVAASGEDMARLRDGFAGEFPAAVLAFPGVVRVTLAVGTLSPVGSDAVETARRAGEAPDAAALLIEGCDADSLRNLESEVLTPSALAEHGFPAALQRGLHVFQYAMSANLL